MKSLITPSFLALVASSLLLPSIGWSQNANTLIAPSGPIPTGVTKLQMQGASTFPLGSNQIIYANLRAVSPSTTLDDYIVMSYAAQPGGFGLVPQKADVYKGVGTYFEDEAFFMRDLTNPGTLILSGKSIPWGSGILLKSAATYTAHLEVGTSITPKIFNPSADYRFTVTEVATGKTFYESHGLRGQSLWHWPVAILRSGAYHIQIAPKAGTAFSAAVTMTHNNGTTTANLKSGNTFNFTLPKDSQAYGKIKMTLAKGQNIRVTLTRSSKVDIWFIGADNTLLSSFSNFGSGCTILSHDAPVSGAYYVVIRKTPAVTSIGSLAISQGKIEIVP